MNAQVLSNIVRRGLVYLTATLLSSMAISVAHAEGQFPTSTVGTPPMPAPTATVGEPPTLQMPAVLPFIETQPMPANTMNLHGVAFEDLNANGKRDAGEPAFSGAWVKVSGGGNWFVCSAVSGNGAFGLPVKAGLYRIQPINLQGYRVTTPQVDVTALGQQPATALIGYVRDATATAESCDSYHPSRPLTL